VDICFVTPAWRRAAMTDVCLAQRQLVINALAAAGVTATCVVVTDDENAAVAASYGFPVVRQDNEWLGRRFNDGMAAAGEMGARWVVPIGSDSWIDPQYLLPLPLANARTGRPYAHVTATRLVQGVVPLPGAGPYLLPAEWLSQTGYRPAEDRIRAGVDASTLRGLAAAVGPLSWQPNDLHPLQYIGFRAWPYITPVDRYARTHGTGTYLNPWDQLASCYPAELVEWARKVLGAQRVPRRGMVAGVKP
jgi:hypothetical protein